ncbi:NAD(P)H-dependent oxidoreductase subunit E, partial [Paracoccus sp. PXZ]
MTSPATDADFLLRLDEIIAAHKGREGPLLPILHDVQAEWGHVPEEAQPVLAEALGMTRAEVHGVVSFYHDFRDHPHGRHVLRLCRAEACQSMGAEALAEEV